ncbi:response regulator [Pontiella sulfatireligans]|uniref:C4-dicarboxylate transport transcriptional regulatory protein DctD n=1 Tax=Pontiella sulfatireligans TaxID=2750658 RepID=A0A6C2ULZ5_9BACT|nr:response regulator [Pontiella sulfatireligans]VGO21290.1 C4-dicarboxylate transport transcriptional regulatory protein DctD [Pontiella sulfatireligans]
MKTKAKTKILVIDDDTAVRESFCFYLEDLEYAVVQATNGREGLKLFEKAAPDIVMVDLRMPDMDGHQVLEKLSQTVPDMPLIVVSGTGRISDTVKALHNGAWDYILKPVNDLSILSHSIEKALERARLLHENRDHQQQLEQEVERRTRELTEKIEEMTRFNRMAAGREHRIIELKRQINALLGELGRPAKYQSPDMIEEDQNSVD